MDATLVQWLLIAAAYVVGIACGWQYFRIAIAKKLSDRYPVNTGLGGVMVAGLAAVLVLVLTPLVIPVPGASGTVQYWVGTPGMLMFFVRTMVFFFLFPICFPLVVAWVVYVIVLLVRKERIMAGLLMVPMMLYLLTLAALFELNPDFAPMV